MSVARCVDICVLAIVRDELVVISKWDANEKVEGSVHSEKVHREVKIAVVLVWIKGGDAE